MRPIHIVSICTVLLVTYLLLWPQEEPKWMTMRVMCLSNVRRQAQGLILYSESYDGRYPNRDHWVDAIAPSIKEAEFSLRCPEMAKGAYGYAFNARLERVPNGTSNTPLVYESANPVRNASDLFTSLPRPGRHRGWDNVADADGHARRIEIP